MSDDLSAIHGLRGDRWGQGQSEGLEEGQGELCSTQQHPARGRRLCSQASSRPAILGALGLWLLLPGWDPPSHAQKTPAYTIASAQGETWRTKQPLML